MQTSLSWWPTNDAVYLYAPQLRQIFQTTAPLMRKYDFSSPGLLSDIKAYLTSPLSSTGMLQNRSKSERKLVVEMVTNYQLIRGLVRLFSLDPMLAFSSLKDVSVIRTTTSYQSPPPTDSFFKCLYLSPSHARAHAHTHTHTRLPD